MAYLHKSNGLKFFSLAKVRSFSVKNSKELISAIGEAVGKSLLSSCSVSSIIHTYEVKTKLTEKRSEVSLHKSEKPGNTLVFKDEPKELISYSFDILKKLGTPGHGIHGRTYTGILYGTIELHKCEKEIICPSCGGTGICSTCDGKKQVTCPVCDGHQECISCNGTGRYSCEHCDGDGICPNCDDGWCTCESCYGEGTVTCPDCGGSGNYIDETCNRCGGSGCQACNGTGRFVRECRRCNGEGKIDCDNCDGEGGWTCEECHGSGKCSHCHGKGSHICKACKGTGKCGKCKGKGRIWCPDCHGKGVCFECKGEKKVICPRCEGLGEYQSYTEYSIDEERTYLTEHCSLPIEKKDISSITGDICFNDVVYDFFARFYNKNNKNNIDSVIQSLQGLNVNIVEKWLSLDNYPLFMSDPTNKYMHISAEIYKIPVSKIVLKCNSKDYNIFVVGNNPTVYYQDLPSWGSRIAGRIRKLFGK